MKNFIMEMLADLPKDLSFLQKVLMTQVIITEKPSVAKDLSKQLGNFVKKDFYFESTNQIISWTYGHLFELSKPKDKPRGRNWN